VRWPTETAGWLQCAD